MNQLHSLLRNQLKRHIGIDTPIPDTRQAFLKAVNEAYYDFDADRLLLERALDISSQELLQANAELHAILHAIPDLLFRIEADSKIVVLAQEGLAMPILPAQAAHDEPPEGLSDSPAVLFWAAIRQVRETQTSVSFEYQEDFNDTEMFYEARLVPFAQREMIGIIRDITIRKQAENALRVSEEAARSSQIELLKAKGELEAEREKLRYLATRDSLTQVWNRRAIFDRLTSEFAQAARQGYPISVIMMDIDNFKKINDNYGHPVGDIVLQETTRRLSSCIRTSDEIGRYGGEEFLIILPDCDGQVAFTRAELLRQAINSSPIPLAVGALSITCSFGVSWTQDYTYASEQVVQEADAALYRAKKAGRNCVETAYTLSSDHVAPVTPVL